MDEEEKELKEYEVLSLDTSNLSDIEKEGRISGISSCLAQPHILPGSTEWKEQRGELGDTQNSGSYQTTPEKVFEDISIASYVCENSHIQ